jgi:alpha-galactosidase
LAAGYNYVNIDDCWSEMLRDNDVKIPESKARFPSGMKSLSDYVSGFKLDYSGLRAFEIDYVLND